MIVLEPEEMQKLDQKVINSGFSSLLLMESAGRQTAEIIKDNYNKENKVLILAGTGNNGGDGFVIARLLDIWNYHVKIIVVGRKEKISGSPLKNIKICELRDIDINYFNGDNFDVIRNEISNHDLIVDSLLGTGLKGNLREPILSIVRLINESIIQVLSVDIPTGIDGNSGKVLKDAVKADITVTMAFSKVGHYLYPGRDYTNELYIVDLGFPEKLIEKNKYKHFVLSLKEANKLLPTRSKTGHKGSFGKVLVIGGSLGYEGAAVLTAESALKSGSGLVKLMVFEEIYQAVSCKKRELITDILTIDNLKKSISDFDVIALGPGLGRGKLQEKIVSYIIKKARCPIVIDADGLNNLNLTDLKDLKKDVVLTPHLGEFARLIDQPINEVQDNRIKSSREFARRYNVNLLLKGASTLVVDANGKVTINTTGNSGMATAGSGDVLTGIIASLSGQGVDIYQSGVLGAYLHGLAGDTAKINLGEYSLLAGDIIDSLPPAISKIQWGC
jgi:NAD(P)H-hydrate epimerase